MTIPTPASLKQKLDEKRASEITPRQAGKTTRVQNLRASKFSEKENSSVPRSSRRNKDSQVSRSSSRTSRPKRSTSSQGNNSRASREVSEITENSQQKASRNSELSKKDFKRPDHLTHRPLLDHEGLWNLMNRMNEPVVDTGYFKFEGLGRTQSKNNKENN